MMRSGSLLASAFLVACSAVVAAAQPPAPPAAARPMRAVDRAELRDQIYVMEGALMRAVQAGAQQLNRQIRSVMPNLMMLSGEPQARGIYLDGYGVYFDVGVPILHQSMVWSLGSMLQPTDADLKALNDLRAQVQKMPRDANRLGLENLIARLELQMGPAAQTPGRAAADAVAPAAAGRMQQPAVGAALVMPETAEKAAEAASAAAPAAAPAPSGLDRQALQDPNAINRAYTESVLNALIGAMIDYSVMRIAPDEWLTVAARDNMQRDSLAPQDPYEEVVTSILQIRGADLLAYRSGQIDKEEVRRRVQIREF